MTKSKTESTSFLVLLAAVSILLYFVFAPFLTVLALAAVAAVLLQKPHEKLARSVGWGPSATAVFTVVLLFVFCIVPLFFLGGQIFLQAQELYIATYANNAQFLNSIQNAIQNPIRLFIPGFVFNVGAYVGSTLAVISNNLAALVYQTLFIIFETFLMLLATFYFLRDGRGYMKTLVEISPLGKEVTTDILEKMHRTITAVMEGTVLNALIRLACISIAFYIFGIPNAILWGSIGGIIGAIPGLGTPFAFIPAVIYLYLAGKFIAAIGLAVVGGLVLFVVDNILGPYFFSRGLEVSPVFVLFSIFGGIAYFGPIGFILGPLVLSIFLAVVPVHSTSGQVA